MSTNEVYVVGDRFRNFSCNENIYLLSDFMRVLETNGQQLKGVRVKPGQGLSFNSIMMIEDAIRVANIKEGLQLDNIHLKPLDKKYVHKHKDHNVLLGHLKKLSATEYTANLFIDERCAEVSDHMTGQHIQGMVLTEAARQMFTAVTEAYILPDELVGRVVYIFNTIEVKFISFVFPLPIMIQHKIIEQNQRKGSSIAFKVEVDFYQNDVLATRANIAFTTYDADYIRSVETEKARQSVAEAIRHRSPDAGATN